MVARDRHGSRYRNFSAEEVFSGEAAVTPRNSEIGNGIVAYGNRTTVLFSGSSNTWGCASPMISTESKTNGMPSLPFKESASPI